MIHELFQGFACVVCHMLILSLLAFDAGESVALAALDKFSGDTFDPTPLNMTTADFVGTVDRVWRRVLFNDTNVTYKDIFIQVDLNGFHIHGLPATAASWGP